MISIAKLKNISWNNKYCESNIIGSLSKDTNWKLKMLYLNINIYRYDQ